jgi:hypothetical protein
VSGTYIGEVESCLYIYLPYIEGENVSGVEEVVGSNVQQVSLILA